MDGFIFGGNTGIQSPEALAKRRALADAIRARNADNVPKNIWEGLNSATTDILGAIESNRLNKAEAEGKASAVAAYQPVIDALKSGKQVGNDVLLGALGNEWGNEGQRRVAQAILGQNLETDAPLTKWQQAQIDVDREKINAGYGNSKYGLNPIWGKDANGNTVLFQLPQSGGAPVQVQFPGGVTPTPGYNYQDMGTFVQPFNTKTGVPGAPMTKDIAGKQAQEEIGTAQGKAAAAAPGDYQAGQNALDLIGDIRNDPNKAWGTGFSSIGNVIPGTPGYDFQNKVDQARSGAFLTAIQQMRGLGALSNAEGSAATAAVNRMSTATSEAEFNAALDAYETIVKQGMDRAAKRGGAPAAAAPDASQNAFSTDPQFGQEVNGFKIGQTARNAQGEVITWDGNGWRR